MRPEALLEAHVEQALTRHGWSGCAAALVRSGEPDVLRGWGVADVAAGRPVDEQTGFRIGSTSKTFTGAAVVALEQQGRLSLDDLVERHVRGFRVTAADGGAVRLRHLASHTSGLGDLRGWGDVLLPKGGTGVRPGRTRPSLDELYAGGLRTALPPGAVWRYVNHGLGVLGAALEGATGRPFEEAVDALVLAPLGLTETGFGRAWLDDPRTATGYAAVDGVQTPVQLLDICVPPAGSAVSRATDMARYLRSLLAPQDRLRTPLHQPDPRQTQTGVVWWMDRLDGHRVVRHGGAWSGFRSFCAATPDDGVALWLGVNADDDAVEQVGLDLLRALLGARPVAEELAARAARSTTRSLPPAGRYTVLGTPRSTVTTWLNARSGLHVRHGAGAAVLHGAPFGADGLALLPVDGDAEDPLYAGDSRGADAHSAGLSTVQVLGTPQQPVLLLDGRTPYVRTTRPRRPWTRWEEVAPATRQQLRALCLDG